MPKPNQEGNQADVEAERGISPPLETVYVAGERTLRVTHEWCAEMYEWGRLLSDPNGCSPDDWWFGMTRDYDLMAQTVETYYFSDLDPLHELLDIEARTGTRLLDNGNPLWFIATFRTFQRGESDCSFAEYVARLWPDRIEVLAKQAATVDLEKIKTIPRSTLRVYEYIQRNAPHQPTYLEMQTDLNVSSSTVKKALAVLRERDLIEW